MAREARSALPSSLTSSDSFRWASARSSVSSTGSSLSTRSAGGAGRLLLLQAGDPLAVVLEVGLGALEREQVLVPLARQQLPRVGLLGQRASRAPARPPFPFDPDCAGAAAGRGASAASSAASASE